MRAYDIRISALRREAVRWRNWDWARSTRACCRTAWLSAASNPGCDLEPAGRLQRTGDMESQDEVPSLCFRRLHGHRTYARRRGRAGRRWVPVQPEDGASGNQCAQGQQAEGYTGHRCRRVPCSRAGGAVCHGGVTQSLHHGPEPAVKVRTDTGAGAQHFGVRRLAAAKDIAAGERLRFAACGEPVAARGGTDEDE